MTATELVYTLSALDVRLAVQGDRLRLDAPRGAITAELRQALIDHKPELLQLLRPVSGSLLEHLPGNEEDTATGPETGLAQAQSGEDAAGAPAESLVHSAAEREAATETAERFERLARMVDHNDPGAATRWRDWAHRERMLAEVGLIPFELPASWYEEWEERAAIREYHGGQEREQAELEALKEIVARMTNAG